MKKIITLVGAILIVFTLAACEKTAVVQEEPLNSQESLVTLAYLSGGMLDTANSSNLQNMSFTPNEESEVESEIEVVNVYMDQLKVFIENGTKNFADVAVDTSDREEYEFKLVFVVSDEEYTIYYNDTTGIEGILIIGDIEYTIEGTDDLELKTKEDKQLEIEEKILEKETEILELEAIETEDSEELAEIAEDIADLQEDILELQEKIANLETEDKIEQKMELVATNLDDEIRIVYKLDTEGEETTTKFRTYSTIGGVYKETEMKISQEEDKYKAEVIEENSKFVFKRNMEEDGITYKLEYEINGEKGQVMIIEETDSEGNIQYKYKIQTKGKEKEIIKGKPESKGRKDKSV